MTGISPSFGEMWGRPLSPLSTSRRSMPDRPWLTTLPAAPQGSTPETLPSSSLGSRYKVGSLASCFEGKDQVSDQEKEARRDHPHAEHRRPQQAEIGAPIHNGEGYATNKKAGTQASTKSWGQARFPLVLRPANLAHRLLAEAMMIIDAAAKRR
jgi:hypothetical protein